METLTLNNIHTENDDFCIFEKWKKNVGASNVGTYTNYCDMGLYTVLSGARWPWLSSPLNGH